MFLLFESSVWTNMFTLGNAESITYLEKIARPILVYFALVFLLRFYGKRELAQLNPFDLVLILLLSNTVQNAIIGNDTSLSGGIVGAIALLSLNYGMAVLKFRSKKVEELVEGKPLQIIKNGELNEQAIRRELMTKEDLDIVAHEQGYDDSDDIENCVLDPNGTFLVEGKDELRDFQFKKEVLRKINSLSKQLAELQSELQKS